MITLRDVAVVNHCNNQSRRDHLEQCVRVSACVCVCVGGCPPSPAFL